VGNLLISMRDISALAVIDGHTEKVVWMLRDVFAKQHDPRILANGRLLLFDNGLARRQASRALELEPKTWQKI
jgi:hypothetical protein